MNRPSESFLKHTDLCLNYVMFEHYVTAFLNANSKWCCVAYFIYNYVFFVLWCDLHLQSDVRGHGKCDILSRVFLSNLITCNILSSFSLFLMILQTFHAPGPRRTGYSVI